jgi:4-amino-4-deoxychorismate lyase
MSDTLNRAFMYGESIFTTMLMINGKVRDWEHHFERFRKGVDYLYGPFTDDEWVASLKNRLEYKIGQENGNKVLRLAVYREQARRSLRSAMISIMDLKIQMNVEVYEPREVKALSMRTVEGIARPQWWPSFLKVGNYLETILSQKIHLKPEDDDLIFTSPDGWVWESSVANIFCVRNNKLYTPPVGPNVLDGIMRRNVIEVGFDFFDDVIESAPTSEQLKKADAIFGTNSVRGPFLIGRIDDKSIEYSHEFVEKFEKLKARVFS